MILAGVWACTCGLHGKKVAQLQFLTVLNNRTKCLGVKIALERISGYPVNYSLHYVSGFCIDYPDFTVLSCNCTAEAIVALSPPY